MHQLLRFLSLFFISNGSLLGVKRQKYRLYLTSDQILQSFAFIKYSYATWYTNCNLVFFFYANINLYFPTGCKHRPHAWGFRFTKGAKANKTPRWRWNIACLSCNFFFVLPQTSVLDELDHQLFLSYWQMQSEAGTQTGFDRGVGSLQRWRLCLGNG